MEGFNFLFRTPKIDIFNFHALVYSFHGRYIHGNLRGRPLYYKPVHRFFSFSMCKKVSAAESIKPAHCLRRNGRRDIQPDNTDSKQITAHVGSFGNYSRSMHYPGLLYPLQGTDCS